MFGAKRAFETNASLSATRYSEIKEALDNFLEIERLVRQKQKIVAIKQVREQLKLGLKEAKWFIDQLDVELQQTYFAAPPLANTTGSEKYADTPTIVDMLASGRKIEAIKLYRQQTGSGLKEAKEAVEVLEDQQKGPLAIRAIEQNHGLVDPDELHRLLRAEGKIQAIKYYRQCTGIGLKEAKDAVDYIAGQDFQ